MACEDGLPLVTPGMFNPANVRGLVNSNYTADVGACVHWRRRFVYFDTPQDKWMPVGAGVRYAHRNGTTRPASV